MFALSGVDIALWDLSQDRVNESVLGGRCRETIPIYASLIRYGNVDLLLQLANIF